MAAPPRCQREDKVTLRISVIVPHYHDLPSLDRCLSALAAQTFPAAEREIIVADNASPEGLAAVEAVVAGRARVVLATERGAGPARNAGVAASTAPLLAFTDADCVPEPGWLEAGMAALDHHDFVGGQMYVIRTPGLASGAEGFERVFGFQNERYVRQVGFTVTANLFCPRAVFDRTGPFRVGVSEDVEWCHRARDAGFRIGYAADARVGHPPRPDWPSLLAKWRRLQSERFSLTATTPRGRARFLAHAWLLPPSILVDARKVLRSPALTGRRERTATLATLARLRLWRFVDAHRRVLGGR